MRAFAQDGLWDRLAARGGLRPAHIDARVEALCALHRDAAVADAGRPGTARRRRCVRRCATAWRRCGRCARTPDERARLERARRLGARAFDTLRGHFDQRQRDGRVRECHGDLHLGNVTQVDGRTTLFDCLEFSAALRWTDVMSDVAFMAMDLQSHGLAAPGASLRQWLCRAQRRCRRPARAALLPRAPRAGAGQGGGAARRAAAGRRRAARAGGGARWTTTSTWRSTAAGRRRRC